MIKAIANIDLNNAIGYKGRLINSFPEDMKFFRETTKNQAVLYGRKTLESFPNGTPLPNRINIVLSRSLNNISLNSIDSADSFFYINNIVDLYEMEFVGRTILIVCITKDLAMDIIFKIKKELNKDTYICGGEAIYNLFLENCEEILLTEVRNTIENADAYFPKFDKNYFTRDHLQSGIFMKDGSEDKIEYEINRYIGIKEES